MNLSTHGTKTSLKARLNEAIDSLEPEQIENLFPVVDQEMKKKEEIASLEKRLAELINNSPIREFQHVSSHSSRDIDYHYLVATIITLLQIASSAEIDEQDVIAYIIKGIPDSIFNKQIMLTANTIADLKNILRKYEKMKSELQSTSSGYNRSVQPSRSVPRVDAKVRCFNCDEEGHISSNCPKARREKGSCFRCGQKGHIITNCPQKSSVLVVQKMYNGISSFNIDDRFSWSVGV
ncbi:uncharacterized protein LOC129948262 [Eupeodes corollae]|uniref:uncharacterized protein LOC129948262 n=1 Tax=Eupeodes corollae TaxID=290404 RepID=UPI002492C83C|nr:uncharacterized protein LOC129948262 [Eupeodes corollae]